MNNKQKYVTKDKNRRIYKKRSKVMGFFILGFFSFLILITTINVLFIEAFQLRNGVDLKAYAEDMYTQVVEEKAQRGNIYASNGEQLAINISSFDMYAVLDNTAVDYDGDPAHVVDADETAKELLDALDLTSDQTASDLFYTQLNNEEVANSKYGQVEFGSYGRSLSIDQKETIEALELPGIKFKTNSERYYPYGDFASYVVGYTRKNENEIVEGELGVEQFLDGYLQGHDAVKYGEFDGNKIALNDDQVNLIEKTDGSNVTLTIDTNVQGFIQSAMDQYYPKESDFDLAYTIVMDVNNGDILGAYALPSFNPNVKDVSYWVDPFNSYCFEPGSTVKALLVSTAMENGVWDPDKTYESGAIHKDEWGKDADGQDIKIADVNYNVSGTTWGTLTWTQGFFLSSNVGMVNILNAVGNDAWEDSFTNRFELGKSVSSELYSTSSCDFSPTYDLEYATSTFGQGVTANALQMLRAYSVIANNGVMVQPHFIETMANPATGEIHYNAEDDTYLQPEQKMEEENADAMLELMQMVAYDTQDGNEPADFGRSGTLYGEKTKTRIAMKTGTSEISTADGYQDLSVASYINSTMIAAPADDPQILVYTVSVNGKTPFTDYAVNSNAEIIDNTIKYLNSRNAEIAQSEIDANTVYVDDYSGQDADEVRANLEEQDLNVIQIGSGSIVSQYPSSAQEISKNQVIVLKADGTYNYEDLKSKTYNEAYSICYAQIWDCNFDGLGIVSKVEKVSDTEYTLTMEEPTKITNDLKNKELITQTE